MRDKLAINRDHYPTDQSKSIYAERRVGEKTLQHQELCLHVNLITFFATIEDLFHPLEDIFGNFYPKEHAMEEFWDLKIGVCLFNDFDSEFIDLAFDLEYVSEMLIWKFKHKLRIFLQDRLISGVELPTCFSALA